MNVTTYALVTFRVCTVRRVMGPRLKSLTRDKFFLRAAIDTLPRKASLHRTIVLSSCRSRRYRQYKLRFKTTATPHLSQLPEDARQPPTPTHSSRVDMVHTCPS
jgi:hypothetical protein